MRTDAKVGLICALALVIAVVAYFVMNNNPKPTVARGTSEVTPALVPATAPAPSGLVIAPPATVIAAAPGGSASPPPAYTPAPSMTDATIITPPATTAPSSGLQITPPGTPRSLLPPVATAPAGPTGLVGGTPTSNRSSTSEIPPYEQPRDSLLEPRTTISSTPPRGSSSSLGGSTYSVQSGDTLTSIAKKNGISLKALEAANPKVDSTHLKIKQVINLPAAGSESSSVTPGGTSGATTRPSRSAAHSGSTTTTPPSTPAAATSYTVKKGDTLRKIAKSVYGDEGQWKVIFRANRDQLDSADDIDVGMVLKIPAK